MSFDITPYVKSTPKEIRQLIRNGEITFPTAGMAAGFAQANLCILPKEYAKDFLTFTKLNPFPCPVLEVLDGSPLTKLMGEDGNILTDIPEYYIYKDGKLDTVCNDATPYYEEGMVGFLIGCSFSFEEALMAAGIEMRHIATGRNVPMYRASIMTKQAGPFAGPMVCSMRPMTKENARIAYEITAAMPNVHGAPVHMGDPKEIGIDDVMKPDYGDSVEIYENEIPVFWPCGVTPQAAIANAHVPTVITHSPGHMFITDIKNSELNDFLERLKG